jgi:hypothetical protein
MDIRFWNTHKVLYLAGCKKEWVEPNEQVVSEVTAAEEWTKPQEQRTLEGWAVTKVPQWTKEGLMEHIVKLVVVDDQVRRAVHLCNNGSALMADCSTCIMSTQRPFLLWTMQLSIVSSCSNALVPRRVIFPTAQVLPMLSTKRHTKSEAC